MSIIHKALKKTQKELEESGGQKEEKITNPSDIYAKLHKQNKGPAPTDKGPAAVKTKTKSPRPKPASIKTKSSPLIGILMFLVFLGAAGTAVYFNYDLIKEKLVDKIPADILSRNDQKMTKRPTPPPPRKYKKDELVLSGTMKNGDKIVALINGEVLETGETVQGMTITAITLKTVELTDVNGQTKVLKK